MPRLLLISVFALGGSATAAPPPESDGQCDNSADPADPDCNQGGPKTCDYANSTGFATFCGSADHAETCDEADNALTCDEATTATTCDSAGHTTTCDTATAADFATGVAECVSGVWGVEGGAPASCGPLRYDGRVGINTDPIANLDVTGTVALRGGGTDGGLFVTDDGKVGIGTETPVTDLTVDGVVIADAFVTNTPQERWIGIVPGTCRHSLLAGGEVSAFGVIEDLDQAHCALNLPLGAVVTGLVCAGQSLDGSILIREGFGQAPQEYPAPYMLTAAIHPFSSLPAIDEFATAALLIEGTATPNTFEGCRVRYEIDQWL